MVAYAQRFVTVRALVRVMDFNFDVEQIISAADAGSRSSHGVGRCGLVRGKDSSEAIAAAMDVSNSEAVENSFESRFL
jgi:hypothetical protein